MIEYKLFENIMNTFTEHVDMYAEVDLIIQTGGKVHEYFIHAIYPVVQVMVNEIVPRSVLEIEDDDTWYEWSLHGTIRDVFWDYFTTTAQIEVETNDPKHRKFVPYREVYTPLVIFEWLMNVREDPETWALPRKNLKSGYSIKDYNDEWGEDDYI